MKVKVQVKDLTNLLEGMDPDAVIFEFDLPAEEIVNQIKARQLEGWAAEIRQKIQEVGLEAYFKVAQGCAAPVLEMQHSGDHGS